MQQNGPILEHRYVTIEPFCGIWRKAKEAKMTSPEISLKHPFCLNKGFYILIISVNNDHLQTP